MSRNRVKEYADTDDEIVRKADLLEACRAVADHTKEQLADGLKGIESAVALTIVKRIDAAIADRLGHAERQQSASLDGFRRELDRMVADRVEELEKRATERVEFLRQANDEAWSRIGKLLDNLQIPAPTVNVLPAEPKIEIPASIVNVTTPKRRTVKSISYDASGRPATVEEREVDDSETPQSEHGI